ncbi:MAG: ABC transporter permease [Dorea sp.]|nr:ABC transporter permease [Dorea sp.]
MLKFTLKRLASLVLVLIGVSFLVFMLLSLTPGDPVRMMLGESATPEAQEALRKEMGLDDPLLLQYGRYMKNIVVHQDLGTSYSTQRPVLDEIMNVFPNTVQLAVAAMVIAVILGIFLGIISAVKQNSLLDNIVMVLALIGTSAPIFWIGILMILLFSVQLGWLPPSGFGSFEQLIMPAVALGMQSKAVVARMTRSSMLEVIRQDFVKTARAKGQREIIVILKHVFRNALIPIITVVGLQFGTLLGGAMLTEVVFSIPGVGRLMIEAIKQRDFPIVQGSVLFVAACFSLVNLAVDLLYAVVDPKVSKE